MIRYRYRLRQKQAEEVGKFCFSMAQASFVGAGGMLFSYKTTLISQTFGFYFGVALGFSFVVLGLKFLKEVKLC